MYTACLLFWMMLDTYHLWLGNHVARPQSLTRSDLIISALCALSQTQFLVGEKQVTEGWGWDLNLVARVCLRCITWRWDEWTLKIRVWKKGCHSILAMLVLHASFAWCVFGCALLWLPCCCDQDAILIKAIYTIYIIWLVHVLQVVFYFCSPRSVHI